MKMRDIDGLGSIWIMGIIKLMTGQEAKGIKKGGVRRSFQVSLA